MDEAEIIAGKVLYAGSALSVKILNFLLSSFYKRPSLKFNFTINLSLK